MLLSGCAYILHRFHVDRQGGNYLCWSFSFHKHLTPHGFYAFIALSNPPPHHPWHVEESGTTVCACSAGVVMVLLLLGYITIVARPFLFPFWCSSFVAHSLLAMSMVFVRVSLQVEEKEFELWRAHMLS